MSEENDTHDLLKRIFKNVNKCKMCGKDYKERSGFYIKFCSWECLKKYYKIHKTYPSAVYIKERKAFIRLMLDEGNYYEEIVIKYLLKGFLAGLRLDNESSFLDYDDIIDPFEDFSLNTQYTDEIKRYNRKFNNKSLKNISKKNKKATTEEQARIEHLQTKVKQYQKALMMMQDYIDCENCIFDSKECEDIGNCYEAFLNIAKQELDKEAKE
ncbi:MAG TPA: hypothetical protein QF753_11745 [Victivallales bacterium]|nr:hypothetical protein [Victivallales bacterium]